MKKVFVGLSGGVDSAVSAALLKERGYEIIGAFIKIWQPEFIECTWREDRLDAMRVCAALEIPFLEIDLSDEYKQKVIADMIDGYAKGITPNPDVLCNRYIKFGDFATWAFKNGAENIATGHYARVGERKGKPTLLRGVDQGKDQSYFLWQLTEADLARTIFPAGDMTKSEIRSLARRFDLPVADKKDSQGLCFVGDVTIKDFLKRFIPVQNGAVIDQTGAQIGEHEGAALYTVGQRHGFIVTKGKPGTQYYITHVDSAKNMLTVSEKREDATVKAVALRDLNWIEDVETSFRGDVETRYHTTPVGAKVTRTAEGAHVQFDEPHIAAPGQSLVIYDGDRVLGGGIIAR